jgi:putative flippase GtrA
MSEIGRVHRIIRENQKIIYLLLRMVLLALILPEAVIGEQVFIGGYPDEEMLPAGPRPKEATGVITGMDGAGCKGTIWQLCKYYIVVCVGAAADFSLFTLLVLSISLHYLLANAISYLVVAIGVYFFQKNWTFQYSGGKDAWVFAKFTTLLAFTYIMSNIILFALVGVLLMDPVLSKAIQIILGALWGYAISKYFVYR